jgi:signal transduction histidine kinase
LAQKLQTEEQKPLLERIRGESVRLDELIGRILLLSNLDSGAEQPENTCFSLNEAVDQVVEDAIFEARRSGQVLTYSAAEGEIAVLGNKELFSSAVENVVRNALKYAKTGPIEVRLTAEHGIATLQVRDYGPGIPNPELEKVFRPFYRLNASAPNHGEGTGLGLAIAYRAIALHKGSVRLRNAAPRGLIVEFQVPTTSVSLCAA